MTSFRIRPWGSADWTQIDIAGDDEEMEGQVADRIRDQLALTDLHAQELGDDGKWEDL